MPLGNHKKLELNSRSTVSETNKAKAIAHVRECIEIEDDELIDEKESNYNNNVNKGRKTKKQNTNMTHNTPKMGIKTPRKTPQKG